MSFPTSLPVSGQRHLCRSGIKFSAILAVLLLGLGLCSMAAETPEEEYLSVINLIDQADVAAGNGRADSAQTKYLEAEKRLIALKRASPTFSPSAVTYRMKYLAGKIVPPPAKTSTPDATRIGDVQVKLISAGAEPRKTLRLHPQAGDKQSLGMTVKMVMEMGTAPAMKMPAMQMGLDVTVKGVTGGDIAYETTVSEASVVDDPDAAPMAAAFDAAMANLKGMTITGVTTDRGVAKEAHFKMPANSDPSVQQTMDQVKTAMAQVALPEEEVGVGAQWSVQRKFKTQGMMVDQAETYEVTALEDDNVTLKTGVTQTTANQKIENPSMPGKKVDISKLETKGTGTATINLGKLVATAGTGEMHTEMSMGMDMGGQTQTMNMKMDVTATIESK